MARRLRAKDIERLENTSPAAIIEGAIGDAGRACPTLFCPSLPDTNTQGCEICVFETDCCDIALVELLVR